MNQLIALIFKCKHDKVNKFTTKLKAKVFLKEQHKKWNDKVELLFESTWRKKIPSELEQQFVSSKKKVNKKIKVTIPKVKVPPTKKQKINKEDDLGSDKPLLNVKETKRKCCNCGNSFIQGPHYPNRMLCPNCNDWSSGIFDAYASYEDNNIEESFDKKEADKLEKHKILKTEKL